jgi:nicotinamidase-related amidase
LKRALLVIDVQNEYFDGLLPVTYPAGSLNNILKVMDAASGLDIPVVVVRHTSPGGESPVFRPLSNGWELQSDVAHRRRDLLIEKKLPGSFTGTELEGWLRDHEVDTVVIAGYMTQMCCDTTARQAMHRGFDVEFLSDATGTLDIGNYAGSVTDEELHRAVLVTQAMRFSRVMSTGEWLESVEGN